ncbi:MAG: cysteine dioxygenase [Roseiflexaceae bacterium]
MADEYILDTPTIRSFIGRVREVTSNAAPEQALAQLRPDFAALLADSTWLPDQFRQPYAASGMGGGIATWLLYRAEAADLSLFALVVPPGSATPVHDHLAWGLVGLYQGTQDEEIFQRVPGSHADEHHAPLDLVERNALVPGDIYTLLPPEGDIHRVITTSAEPSISIHMLGNDTGCVVRHAYTPEDSGVRAFRSGWSNVACRAEDEIA